MASSRLFAKPSINTVCLFVDCGDKKDERLRSEACNDALVWTRREEGGAGPVTPAARGREGVTGVCKKISRACVSDSYEIG